eukprot:GDKJ01003283.1.p1 GENE.GDKJ01003283.1~~GDKJ01003283.1.p1  ORF type:complete len:300 (+),score=60.31 GDKJ01003283.1:1-900(+)
MGFANLVMATCNFNLAIASFNEDKRIDLRNKMQSREISLKFDDDHSRVEVSLGKTLAVAIVTAEISEPNANRPNEGTIQYHVDLGPMANPNFQLGRDAINNEISNDIGFYIERMIRGSHAVDTEALCITANEKVWNVRVDVRAINDDGNLRDCCALAALCGLIHYKHNELVIDDKGEMTEVVSREPIPLSIHHYPVSVTFAARGDSILLDPSSIEEQAAEGFISIAINQFGEVCGIHKPGGIALSQIKIMDCIATASLRATELTQLINDAKKAFEAHKELQRKNIHDRYHGNEVTSVSR